MEEEKKPIVILLTDTHLSENTIDQNFSAFSQAIDIAKSLGVSYLLHLGDIFTSRKGQPEIVLTSFRKILDKIFDNDLQLLAINGNHDKTSGVVDSSFLDAFVSDRFRVMEVGENLTFNKVSIFFLSYFDEHLVYPSKLTQLNEIVELNDQSINLLLTHCAIDGVINNSGLKVKGELSIKGFEKFQTVFVGHYHNRQIFSNICYIGSTDPRNFGEDDQKGVTIVYDDGSYDFINLEFKPYVTIDMLASDLTLERINQAKQKGQEANLRFRIQGEVNEQLKPLVAQLNDNGVKVEVHKQMIVGTDGIQASQVTFTSGDIIELYDSWSEDRKIEDKEFGEKLLRDRL